MSNYLMFASRDVFESKSATHFCDLATQLKRSGHEVVLYLVQNAVLAARTRAQPLDLHQAIAAGVKVWVDDVCGREHGLPPRDLVPGAQVAGIDQAVGLLAAGWKPLWH